MLSKVEQAKRQSRVSANFPRLTVITKVDTLNLFPPFVYSLYALTMSPEPSTDGSATYVEKVSPSTSTLLPLSNKRISPVYDTLGSRYATIINSRPESTGRVAEAM